jgi:hypothetical protein
MLIQRRQLPLTLGIRLYLHRVAAYVWVGRVPCQAIDLGVLFHQLAQHVIKGAVLHHQHDDVLEVIQIRLASFFLQDSSKHSDSEASLEIVSLSRHEAAIEGWPIQDPA